MITKCSKCGSSNIIKFGMEVIYEDDGVTVKLKGQRYLCDNCSKVTVEPLKAVK
jgi:phage terminase large subunit GpA-like protein